MWFKNLSVFRFSEPIDIEANALAGRLEPLRARPCGSFESASLGWAPPLGRHATELVHPGSGRLLLCLQIAEKLLPAPVIREAVDERVAEIERQEQRTVRSSERRTLREAALAELLPRALVANRRVYGYLDPRAGWLVVDATSRKTIDDFTALLRRAADHLPVAPLRVRDAPALVMTGWLARGTPPAGFAFDADCELRDSDESGGKVRCIHQDLASDEIQGHLEAGKLVSRLGLTWQDRVSLMLTEEMEVRRLRFLDVVQDEVGEAESAEALADAQFVLMSGELDALLSDVVAAFGGPASAGAPALAPAGEAPFG